MHTYHQNIQRKPYHLTYTITIAFGERSHSIPFPPVYRARSRRTKTRCQFVTLTPARHSSSACMYPALNTTTTCRGIEPRGAIGHVTAHRSPHRQTVAPVARRQTHSSGPAIGHGGPTATAVAARHGTARHGTARRGTPQRARVTGNGPNPAGAASRRYGTGTSARPARALSKRSSAMRGMHGMQYQNR